MFSFEMAGVPFIYGSHREVEAEVSVTTISALTAEQVDFVTMVLDGVERI